MIKSFSDKETRKVWNNEFSKKLPHNIQRTALIKLRYLEAAESINDLRTPPGNHLETLKGNRKGQYSIRINNQWRICFKWTNEHAEDVSILDYH